MAAAGVRRAVLVMTGRRARMAGRCTACTATARTTGTLGEPLCAECYDYVGHVLWQWHAPELWRRFSIALGRTLARMVGVTRKEVRDLARVSYTKVAEFQAR